VLSSKEDASKTTEADRQPAERGVSDWRRYSPSDFNFVKILGKGSFGKVRKTHHAWSVKNVLPYIQSDNRILLQIAILL